MQAKGNINLKEASDFLFFAYFLKVAALMVSTITHAFVILGMLEGNATEILMTAALLLVITVRLLGTKKLY